MVWIPVIDYYAFRKFDVEVRGHRIAVFGKPGVWSWDALDPGTAALLEVAEVGPGDRVLDLGCGTGVVGAAAARLAERGCVMLIDCHAAAAACARRTLEGVANAEVLLADGVAGLAPGSFDLVLSHLPRGRAVQEELLYGAAWVLRPGGTLYFVAHRRSGIKGAIDYARGLLGRCGVVRQKKGYHVAQAVRPVGLELAPPQDGYRSHSTVLDGVPTMLVGKPGVFAWDRVDDGTAALVGAMEIGVRDLVLDQGCGTGLAGLAAARRASEGHVVLVDVDVRAVESARRTLEANGIANGEVLLSDCGSAVLDRRFDVVIANPPFHQDVRVDDEVACQFVRDAARLLNPGGRFFLVANRFLRYGDLIGEVLGNVRAVHVDNRYHVLAAMAQGPGLE